MVLRENSIKMHDLGVPLFQEIPISGQGTLDSVQGLPVKALSMLLSRAESPVPCSVMARAASPRWAFVVGGGSDGNITIDTRIMMVDVKLKLSIVELVMMMMMMMMMKMMMMKMMKMRRRRRRRKRRKRRRRRGRRRIMMTIRDYDHS